MKILDSDEDDSRPKRIIYAEKRAEELAEKSKERRFFVYIYLFFKIVIYFIFVFERGSCSILILRTVYESEMGRLFSRFLVYIYLFFKIKKNYDYESNLEYVLLLILLVLVSC
jgi:hypothetical protein